MTKPFSLNTLTVLLTGVFASGCAVSQIETETASGAPLARQIAQSAHCGLSAPGHLTVTREEDLDKLEGLPGRNLSLAPLRAIDFAEEKVVLVAAGQKPTGGYSVTLMGSEIENEELRLTVSTKSPGPGDMVVQVLTTPCAAIAVTASGWDDIRVTRAENNR